MDLAYILEQRYHRPYDFIQGETMETMRKSRNTLQDETATILHVGMPQFDDAKAAIGRRCTVAEARSGLGSVFKKVEGTIIGVDSRPFKGGKDAVYVVVKSDVCELYLYAEFSFVALLPPENPIPGPVLPRTLRT